MQKFPINIITTLPLVENTKNLILEIRSINCIENLSQYGFSELQISKIGENFITEKEKQKKTIVFSHISSEYDTVICFFP
jgi:hypothetical protein